MEPKEIKVKLVFIDVDGVLTDGRIIMNEKGEESKSFHVKDGLGLKMLVSAGIEVALVTGRRSQAVLRRAEELGIRNVCQGISDKAAACRAIRQKMGLRKSQIACIGDDLPDLGMFRESGLRIAVGDAAEELQREADLVTQRFGGQGAVREACEWILRASGAWPKNGFTEQSGG